MTLDTSKKTNKYAHFVTDLAHLNCKVTCFEISSSGFINNRNNTHLKYLHQFTKPGIKLSTFKKNISALCALSSYHIWLCRSDPSFTQPPYLPPPFVDKWIIDYNTVANTLYHEILLWSHDINVVAILSGWYIVGILVLLFRY